MTKMQFSIEINASKEKVWTTLWEDKTLRDWSNIIDEGTYMKGIMEEGNEVRPEDNRRSNRTQYH